MTDELQKIIKFTGPFTESDDETQVDINFTMVSGTAQDDGSNIITEYRQYNVYEQSNNIYHDISSKYQLKKGQYKTFGMNQRLYGIMEKGKVVDLVIDYGLGFLKVSKLHKFMKSTTSEINKLTSIIQKLTSVVKEQQDQITQLMYRPSPLFEQTKKHFESLQKKN